MNKQRPKKTKQTKNAPLQCDVAEVLTTEMFSTSCLHKNQQPNLKAYWIHLFPNHKASIAGRFWEAPVANECVDSVMP